MTKLSIFKRRTIREFNSKEMRRLSIEDGYDPSTYYGFEDLDYFLKTMVKKFTKLYGKGLRNSRGI